MVGNKKAKRANQSRAKEFDLMFGFLNNPTDLHKAFKANPLGTKVDIDGITFEFGNIALLLPSVKSTNPIKPFDIKPKYVIHVDRLSTIRKKAIENRFKLLEGVLSSQRSKVDLCLIDDEGKPLYISFKDASSICKLGQISREESYGNAKLKGGRLIEIDNSPVPEQIDYSMTSISKSRFSSLGPTDQKFAYIKRNLKKEWAKIVQENLQNAYSQLEEFGDILSRDSESLQAFIRTTFTGVVPNLESFYLLLGEQPISFKELMSRISHADFQIIPEMVKTDQKKALILKVKFQEKEYGLTRIEPSFDGHGAKTLQTKGIIYYFQQYPNHGNHYKQLFLDVMK